MLTIHFREPVAPRYIYINPENNRVHLLVPIVGGTEIGTDNTCQSVIAQQRCFGKNAGANLERSSALDELRRYLRALQFDISILEETPLKRQKQERADQIAIYIQTLQVIQSRSELNALGGAYPAYPEPVQEILSRRTNFFSMVLHPQSPDGFLRSVNPVFSVDRIGPQQFYRDLIAAYHQLRIAPQQDPKDRLMQAVISMLPPSGVDFDAIQAALTTQTQALFGVTVNYLQDNTGAELTREYIDSAMGTASSSAADYVETLINCCAGTLWETLPISPFIVPNTSSGKETLSIVTQFFLAQVNIYCYANELSGEDFGKILDRNQALGRQILAVVKQALEAGTSVEAALFHVINTNLQSFNLARPLSSEDMASIQRRFTSQYITIKDSPHFDEFAVFDSSKLGSCMTHQGSICFDLSDLMGTAVFRELDSPYFRGTRELSSRIARIVPHKNECVLANYQIEEDGLRAKLIQLMQTSQGIETAVELLLSDTDIGEPLFQIIDDNTKAALLQAPGWPSLRNRVAAHISNPAIQRAFNLQFPSEAIQFAITAEMANAIRIAAIEIYGPDICPDVPTGDNLKRMIEFLTSNAEISVERSAGNGFVLTSTQAMIDTIQSLINENTHRIYLSPDMARNIYIEVTEHLGAESPQIAQMNRLDNTGEVPHKLIEALRLAGIAIPRENITFPANGYQGYVLTASPRDLQIIANIQQHRSRFHLTPAIATSLYRIIDQMGWGIELNQLDNRYAPSKIRRALELVNIPYTNLAFNGTNGYWINASVETQHQLLEIGAGREPVHLRAQARERRVLLEQDANIDVLIPTFARPIAQAAAAGAAAASPAAAAVVRQVTMERVLGFNGHQGGHNPNVDLVQLNCPDSILQAFRSLLQGTPLLGASYTNPYTGELETIPLNVAELTSRHLQILARNESSNVTGIMNLDLYQGLLTPDQVAQLRCLVKATTIAGTATVMATGGYGAARVAINPPQRMIIIDQAGLQWQSDLKNTGGMFFYSSGLYSPTYQAWQTDMYQSMYGLARPLAPSVNSIPVNWLGVPGRLDLSQVANAIRVEFSQAFDAAVSQGNLVLAPEEQIHFRFLKAGMGFFASGLNDLNFAQLEHARLLGIEQALQSIAGLSEAQRRLALGRVRSIELPFSNECRGQAVLPPELDQTLQRIRAIVEQLGITWAGAGRTDALAPKPGFVIATTNCADPHAMIGNEGGYSSVDAAISSNAQLDHLNACFNPRMQRRSSPSFAPEAAAPMMPAAAAVALGQFGLLAPAQARRMPQIPDQVVLRQVILHFRPTLQRGSWMRLCSNPLVEVGIGGYSGNSGLATARYQVELQGEALVILDKQEGFRVINDEAFRRTILHELLQSIPESIREMAIAELRAQQAGLLAAARPY